MPLLLMPLFRLCFFAADDACRYHAAADVTFFFDDAATLPLRCSAQIIYAYAMMLDIFLRQVKRRAQRPASAEPPLFDDA